MKAYKFEIIVIDHENIGEKYIIGEFDTMKHITPHITRVHVKDIGNWSDDHLMNKDIKNVESRIYGDWESTDEDPAPQWMNRKNFVVDLMLDEYCEDRKIDACFGYMMDGKYHDIYYDDQMKTEHYVKIADNGDPYLDEDHYEEDIQRYIIPKGLRQGTENGYETRFEIFEDAIEWFKELGFGTVRILNEDDESTIYD